MDNIKNLWEKSLAYLEKETTSVSFDTWIKDIAPVCEAGDIMYFEVSNDLHKNIATQRYRHTIKSALLKAAGESGLLSEYNDIDPVFLTKSDIALLNLTVSEAIIDKPDRTQNPLNPNYTFDTYVVGNSNKFAHAACRSAAERPGRDYNPIFLYGGSGLGKTHLMQAIGNYIYVNYPEAKFVYISSEAFTNEFIASIASNQTSVKEQFRNKYRNVDVLLIDDIQFIGDKYGIQEEIFHTFNTLYEANKQIVITSDKPPKEIQKLEERLRSRFEWGLTADIQNPDFETKVAILIRKAQKIFAEDFISFDIPNDVLHFIAQRATSNVRELEGSLQKVIAYSKLHQRPVTVELAEESLKDFFKTQTVKRISPRYIIEVICEYFEISLEDIKSKKKNRELAYPRQISMYLIRTMTETSLPKIGEFLGGRDHTTVMHAIEKIQDEINNNPETDKLIKDLGAKIRE